MSPLLARAARIRLGPGTPQCMAQGITHLPSKFQAYLSVQMASSTDQTRQCTGGVQIGCACIARASCTPAQFLGSILYRSSSSISVPNLVSLAQRFPEPEDPLPKTFSAPRTCAVHPSGTETTKDRGSQWGSCDLHTRNPGRPPFDLQP